MSIFIALIILIVATWLSCVEQSLRNGPRSRLLHHLEHNDRQHLSDRLAPRLDGAADTLALLSWIASAAFLMLWISGLTLWPPSTGHLILGAATGAVMLWIACSIIASSVARWAGGGLLCRSLLPISIAASCGDAAHSLSKLLNEIVRRLSGAALPQNGRSSEAEAELLRSIEEKHREGELDQGAATLLENIMEFTDTDVGEVMTPRTEIEGLEFTDDLAAIRHFIIEAGHSRIPVYREDLDHIEGILYVKDLVPFLGEDSANFSMTESLRRPIVIPETKPVADLLADFQRAEVHMAIVVDEFGGTAGLATIEDVLEEIVGEIKDEHEGDDDDDEPTITECSKQMWEVDGRFHIDDLNEIAGLSLPENEEYDTVGGWFTATIGRVPDPDESLEVGDVVFTVLEAQPTHVIRLRVARRDEDELVPLVS
jgi:putative hemolysin